MTKNIIIAADAVLAPQVPKAGETIHLTLYFFKYRASTTKEQGIVFSYSAVNFL